ncbi:hypothetical protein B296_00034207 [Ensete ventricosum]|uniref:Uncharacterized protein n=1 Tax=Ensete ventricosum TaxID=4639 RepID=A0A426Z370_ENSVE|nr:hypothetical protein B296_00034207 [Ensete ventricosum]
MSVLEPIISLDRISLEVYCSDVDHGCIQSLVMAEILFRARDPLGMKEDYDDSALKLEGCPRVVDDGSNRFGNNKIWMQQVSTR